MSTKTMGKRQTSVRNKDISCMFYILMIMIFYPPFFRGLFFQKELMPTHILTAIIFIVYFYFQRKEESHHQYGMIELCFIVLTILYGLSFFIAANRDLAQQESLKYINYLIILTMAKRLINSPGKMKITLAILLSAGVAVVLIGVGTALETFHYEGAFVGGMMNSTFQYHNTFGIYCLSVLFIGYMLSGKYSGKAGILPRISTFIMFFGLLLSYSRGAWVLIPLMALLYYILMPIDYKKLLIAEFIGNVLAVAVVVNPFIKILEHPNKTLGWVWLLVGVGISLAISYGIEILLNKLELKERIYNYFLPVGALGIPLVGLLFKDKILGLLPNDLAQRMATISLGTETVTERTVFYKDAFNIIKDYPLLGAGGGGWGTLYPTYQSYAYVSSQTHNYYMQLWIEIGTIGIVVLAVLLLMYAAQSYKTYRCCEDIEIKAFLVSIFIAVTTIFVHSAIDFNFALSAVAIYVWTMVGMQLSIGKPYIEINNKLTRSISYILLLLSIILFGIATMNYLAFDAVSQGIEYMKTNQTDNGIVHLRKAAKLAPLRSDYLADYANISNYLATQNNDQEGIKKSIKEMDRAVLLGRYDKTILTSAAGFYFRNQEIDKAMDAIHQLEEHFPLVSETYENKTSLYVVAAKHYLEIGKNEEARTLLEQVLEVENTINVLNQRITETVKINSMVKFVEITQQTQNNIEEARALLANM